jgi:hypothetical protein
MKVAAPYVPYDGTSSSTFGTGVALESIGFHCSRGPKVSVNEILDSERILGADAFWW